MNGCITFLIVKRNMDFIVEADLDTVGFMVIHYKDYFNLISRSFRVII